MPPAADILSNDRYVRYVPISDERTPLMWINGGRPVGDELAEFILSGRFLT